MNNASIFFLIASLIIPFTITASNPLSQRGLGIHVSGRLCCTGSGTCPSPSPSPGNLCTGNFPSPGLSNVLVNLVCTTGEYSNSYIGVGQNLTDVNGSFEIIERAVPAVNLDQEQPTCLIWIGIPVIAQNCPRWSGTRTGFLVGPIRFYGVKRAPFGFVREGEVPAFIRLLSG